MTDKEWNAMIDRAVDLMRDAAQERRSLDLDSDVTLTDRNSQLTRIRRKYARDILLLALSPEEALGAAQKG